MRFIKILALILFSFGNNNCYSQTYFSKMYNFYNVWESAANILYYDTITGKFSITGTARDFFTEDTLKHGAVYSAEINIDGAVYETKVIFAKDSIRYYTHVGLQVKNIIILKSNDLKVVNGSENLIKYEVVLFNNSGDTIFKRPFIYNQGKFDGLLMIGMEERLFIFGKDITNSSSTTAPFAILCIDTTGKQLWYKTYPGKRRYTNSIVIDDEGNFVIAGSSYKGDGGAFDTTSGWYAKLDTAGNFIWERFLDKDSITKAYYTQVFKHQNTYMLFSGNDASRPNQLDTNESFVSNYTINHYNGDLIKYRRFLYNEQKLGVWVDMHISSNSGMYGIGGFETKEGQFNYTQYLMFLKLDNDGNVKWQRFFKQWYKDNRAFSLTAVPDGFIICADGKDTTHTTGFTDAWIIKTDTNGCIIPGCHLTDGLVQITNPDAFINVYPNPASDNVTVQITDERAKLKSYFIYDAQGNFILQQAIHHTPETFSINTQQLPNGNYYLVLELAGGERAVKKLMIQR